MATEPSTGRSVLAAIVGYLIVAIVVLFLFKLMLGTIFWLFRSVVIIVALLALVSIYLRLKSPD